MRKHDSIAKRPTVTIVLVTIFIVLAVITLPGFFQYFYRVGTGYAFREIAQSENIPWDSMTAAQRVTYQARAEAEGFKCAMLMTFGQHIPGFLFVLITIGLLTRSISHGFRTFLRFAFLGVWILGMLFLALGAGYWGKAPPLSDSLGPAFIIYLVTAAFFGIIIGIGKLIQHGKVKRREPAPSLRTVDETDPSSTKVSSVEQIRTFDSKESGHSDEHPRKISIDSEYPSKSTIRAFISYRSLDGKFAKQLATDLRRRDIHAWLDEWNMAPGKPLEKAMIQGVESCNVMLLVLSRASVKAIETDSGGVPFEFGVGKNRALSDSTFKIIGVLMQYCIPPKDLVNSIGRWINFVKKRKYEQRVDELAEWIKNPEADLGPSVTNAGKMPITPSWILLSLIFGLLKSWGVAFVTIGVLLAILIPLALNWVWNYATGELKENPVYLAVAAGNINKLDSLLLAGEDPDQESGPLNSRALHLAARNNNLTAARKLLTAKANPNVKDRYGWSPLHHTITSQECHPEMIELLCESGASPNQMDNRQRSPLHRAAAFGCDEAVRVLLQFGADPNVKNRYGITPAEAGQAYESVIDVFNQYFEKSGKN